RRASRRNPHRGRRVYHRHRDHADRISAPRIKLRIRRALLGNQPPLRLVGHCFPRSRPPNRGSTSERQPIQITMTPILLPGIRGESLLGFLAGLGTLRVLAREFPEIKLSWSPAGGGWIAQLHVPAETLRDADHVSEVVFAAINESRVN